MMFGASFKIVAEKKIMIYLKRKMIKEGNARQRTDYLEGFGTQEKWSSPASSLLSYSILEAINNIKYW